MTDDRRQQDSDEDPGLAGRAGNRLRQTWEGTKDALADTFGGADRASDPDSPTAPNPLAEDPVLVIPESHRPARTTYENRTVDELRDLAAERDIPGRSTMTKDELVAALRDPSARPDTPERSRYENRTVDELRDLAAERDIPGRSTMSKDELIAALRG